MPSAAQSGAEPPCWPGRVIDLAVTGGGLAVAELTRDGFHLHHCLEDSDRHRLVIDIDLPSGQAWSLSARLVWINSRPEDPDRRYRLGVSFPAGSLPPDWLGMTGGHRKKKSKEKP